MTQSLQEKTFNGKTVLITGHTGFKGSWLSIWLHGLGARIIGISHDIPSNPSNFEVCGLQDIVEDHRVELDDLEKIQEIVRDTQPDFVFHLAAQALVNRSYQNPIETLRTNIIGSAHILEALRSLDTPCTVVMITSDKCYDNVEWEWGYRENDRLGGKDPYSASKGGSELVIRTYFESYFNSGNIRLGIARAGNVIGGGDWAVDRLVPDCIRSWSQNKFVTIKNPTTTRPWQLVLEPLGGYLCLAMALANDGSNSGEAFNFGPLAENNFSVKDVIQEMQKHWSNVDWALESDQGHKRNYEAGLLKLNCDKALHRLAWRPTYNFTETIETTISWYRAYYQNQTDMLDLCRTQIDQYCNASRNRGIEWAA